MIRKSFLIVGDIDIHYLSQDGLYQIISFEKL